MRLVTAGVILGLSLSALAQPVSAQSVLTQSSQVQAVSGYTNTASYSEIDIDTVIAPIALYPDTVLTHILIASTYPLDVIAADRWRQQNTHLSPEQARLQSERFDWDPSVQALVPFTDVLHNMANDLTWLEQLGDMVVVNEDQVLARVQALRQHAVATGSLTSNNYLNVVREREVIIVEPRSYERIYLPYYEPRTTFSINWGIHVPFAWHRPRHSNYYAGIYWSNLSGISASFYFGNIFWPERRVVISRHPVRTYYSHRHFSSHVKRDFRRWQPRVNSRDRLIRPQNERHALSSRSPALSPSRSHSTKAEISSTRDRTHQQMKAKLSSHSSSKAVEKRDVKIEKQTKDRTRTNVLNQKSNKNSVDKYQQKSRDSRVVRNDQRSDVKNTQRQVTGVSRDSREKRDYKASVDRHELRERK